MGDVFTAETEFDEDDSEPKETKGGVDSPVSNADNIPLFEDADKRGTRTAAYITVTKLDAPKSGYKGQIPLNSTLETIAQLFGNGIYNISACNHKHKVLRSKENLKIDIPLEILESSAKTANGNAASPSGQPILEILKTVTENHKGELERQKELSATVTTQVTENSKSFVELIKTSTEAAAQREREFLLSTSESNKQFFATMMSMQSAQFQQMMIMMMAGHNQTIESLKTTNAQNNPLLMVEVLMRGLQMGKSLDGDDSPDWLKAIGMGKDMIGELGSLAKLKMLQTPATITPKPEEKGKPKDKGKEKGKGEDNKILKRSELVEIIKLKRTLLKRGIDLEAMLSEANKHYAAPTAEQESEPESDDEIEDDTEEKGDADSPDNVE